MSNPFKTKDRMYIPRDLEDCCVTDDAASELWRIAELVESWGAFLLIAILVLGTVVSIGITSFMSKIAEGSGFTAFLCSAIVWGVLAVLVYAGCHLISLTIRAFASIVQNTRVSANVALYTTANSTRTAERASTTPVVPNFYDTPTEKNIHIQPASHPAESPNQTPVSPVIVSPEEIVCPNCGTKQRSNRKCCFNCNQLFSHNN